MRFKKNYQSKREERRNYTTLSTTKTISINGTSTVDANGVKTPVAYFNAQIQIDGKYNINQSVQNVDAYKSNKDVVKADYDEFEAYVETFTE